MRHFEAILKWLEVPTNDQSLVVDTAELESKLGYYKREVDALLEISPIPENRDILATKVANLQAAAQAVRMVCDDSVSEALKSHLEREENDLVRSVVGRALSSSSQG